MKGLRLRAFLRSMISRLPLGLQRSLHQEMLRAFQAKSHELASLHYRPLAASGHIPSNWHPDLKNHKVAIILQGPLALEEAFTLQTLTIYQHLGDLGAVILSTWEDAPPKIIQKIRDLGVEVVLSSQPEHPGLWNINRQVKSTMAGLLRARELGCTHALKSRTDQRIHSHHFASMLLGLLAAFPCRPESGHRQRIAVASMNSYIYRPYSLTDMMVFGDLEDMLDYWNLPENTETVDAERYRDISLADFLTVGSPEMLLMEHFMSVLGNPLNGTLENYHDIVQDHYIIVDHGMLDLTWQKKQSALELPDRHYGFCSAREAWTFSQWLAQMTFRPRGQKVACNLANTQIDGVVHP